MYFREFTTFARGVVFTCMKVMNIYNSSLYNVSNLRLINSACDVLIWSMIFVNLFMFAVVRKSAKRLHSSMYMYEWHYDKVLYRSYLIFFNEDY